MNNRSSTMILLNGQQQQVQTRNCKAHNSLTRQSNTYSQQPGTPNRSSKRQQSNKLWHRFLNHTPNKHMNNFITQTFQSSMKQAPRTEQYRVIPFNQTKSRKISDNIDGENPEIWTQSLSAKIAYPLAIKVKCLKENHHKQQQFINKTSAAQSLKSKEKIKDYLNQLLKRKTFDLKYSSREKYTAQNTKKVQMQKKMNACFPAYCEHKNNGSCKRCSKSRASFFKFKVKEKSVINKQQTEIWQHSNRSANTISINQQPSIMLKGFKAPTSQIQRFARNNIKSSQGGHHHFIDTQQSPETKKQIFRALRTNHSRRSLSKDHMCKFNAIKFKKDKKKQLKQLSKKPNANIEPWEITHYQAPSHSF